MVGLVEQLRKLSERGDRLGVHLNTITELQKQGQFKYDETHGILHTGTTQTELLYDDEANVVVMKGNRKDHFPRHAHIGAIQYLVCVTGKFLVEIYEDKTISRVLEMGECVAIPISVEHSLTVLEDNTKCIGINVPPDPAYKVKNK